MQIDPFLSPCIKLKSKRIKDLHIKPDTLKLIEEKVGQSLGHRGKFPEQNTNGLTNGTS
jgi:ribosomal protein L1